MITEKGSCPIQEKLHILDRKNANQQVEKVFFLYLFININLRVTIMDQIYYQIVARFAYKNQSK